MRLLFAGIICHLQRIKRESSWQIIPYLSLYVSRFYGFHARFPCTRLRSGERSPCAWAVHAGWRSPCAWAVRACVHAACSRARPRFPSQLKLLLTIAISAGTLSLFDWSPLILFTPGRSSFFVKLVSRSCWQKSISNLTSKGQIFLFFHGGFCMSSKPGFY